MSALPDRDDLAMFLLLVDLERVAMGRIAELHERHEDRKLSRRARRPMIWQASAEEVDDDATLLALQFFTPTAWWGWTEEEWAQRPPPVEAV